MRKKNSLSEIHAFLEPGKLVIAGASRDPKKFGGMVFSELKKRGFELYPVHPEAREIQGVRCYRTFGELPPGLEKLYVVTPASETTRVVEAAASAGLHRLWIQQKSETPEALELASNRGMEVISGRCVMMFNEPVGSVHRIHRWFSKLFKSYPE